MIKKILKNLAIFGASLALITPLASSALSVYLPFQGGTGTSTIPTIGQVLVGQSNGTYAPQATSTLGIGGGSQTPWTSDIDGGGFNLSDVGVVSIGGGMPSDTVSALKVNGRIGGYGVGASSNSNEGFINLSTPGGDVYHGAVEFSTNYSYDNGSWKTASMQFISANVVSGDYYDGFLQIIPENESGYGLLEAAFGAGMKFSTYTDGRSGAVGGDIFFSPLRTDLAKFTTNSTFIVDPTGTFSDNGNTLQVNGSGYFEKLILGETTFDLSNIVFEVVGGLDTYGHAPLYMKAPSTDPGRFGTGFSFDASLIGGNNWSIFSNGDYNGASVGNRQGAFSLYDSTQNSYVWLTYPTHNTNFTSDGNLPDQGARIFIGQEQGYIGLVIQGDGSSSDLQQWKDQTGNILVKIGSDGSASFASGNAQIGASGNMSLGYGVDTSNVYRNLILGVRPAQDGISSMEWYVSSNVAGVVEYGADGSTGGSLSTWYTTDGYGNFKKDFQMNSVEFQFFPEGGFPSTIGVDGSASFGGGVKLADYSSIGLPVEGQIAWDYTNHKQMVYSGSAWETVSSL